MRAWWGERKENERAWKVTAEDLLQSGCNLDRENPASQQELQHLPPQGLAEEIIKGEQHIAAIMHEIMNLLESKA